MSETIEQQAEAPQTHSNPGLAIIKWVYLKVLPDAIMNGHLKSRAQIAEEIGEWGSEKLAPLKAYSAQRAEELGQSLVATIDEADQKGYIDTDAIAGQISNLLDGTRNALDTSKRGALSDDPAWMDGIASLFSPSVSTAVAKPQATPAEPSTESVGETGQDNSPESLFSHLPLLSMKTICDYAPDILCYPTPDTPEAESPQR